MQKLWKSHYLKIHCVVFSWLLFVILVVPHLLTKSLAKHFLHLHSSNWSYEIYTFIPNLKYLQISERFSSENMRLLWQKL